MTDGIPTSMNKFFNSSHTAFAVKDFSRYTAGHLVHESTMHKQYLRPAAAVGSIGPTTSIVIRLNAISSLGIGVIGTLSITKLLAFNWHFSQDLQNVSTSRLILGQTKDNLILSLVFSSPRCPPNAVLSNLFDPAGRTRHNNEAAGRTSKLKSND